MKLILKNHQSPGDTVCLLFAIKAIKSQYPDFQIDVRTPSPDIFLNSPYITKLCDCNKEVKVLDVGYPLIHKSGSNVVHYLHGFLDDICKKLDLKIDYMPRWQDTIFLSNEEQRISPVWQIIKEEVPYIVIAPGYKKDFTCKSWGFSRWQKLINKYPQYLFVQVGANSDNHVNPKLYGDNLLDLTGRTTIRQLIQIIYHSYIVVSLVSFPMILGYTIKPNSRLGKYARGVITIAGSREPATWEMGFNHQFIHNCGMLNCSGPLGSCWKSRVVPLNDGDVNDKSICTNSVKDGLDVIPKCMALISVDMVANYISMYMESLAVEIKSPIFVQKTKMNGWLY